MVQILRAEVHALHLLPARDRRTIREHRNKSLSIPNVISIAAYGILLAHVTFATVHPDRGDKRMARRTGSRKSGLPRGAALLALPILFFAIAFFPPVLQTAHAEEGDVVLQGSGVHYPGGFDTNTVGEVQGKAYGLAQPQNGPVRFRLETGNETYTVLTSSGWYWKDLKTQLSDGSNVVVQGSKTLGNDMQLYIVAQKIRMLDSGRTVVLRDEAGNPLWKGRAGGATGTQGGFMGGGGSMGGGFGGMGGGMGGRRR
jgi:hypothetical protein